MSEWKTLRGKEFPDGVVRYYNPHEHRWMTEEELDNHNKEVESGDSIYFVGSILLVLFFTIIILIGTS